jgi:hypothetical protein
VDNVESTPTEPRDYAAISATYGSLALVLLIASRERAQKDPITVREVLPLGGATFALSKLVAKEKAETWLRAPFVDEDADGGPQPKGRGLRYAVGELLTCSRCVGAWSALAIVSLRLASPDAGRTAAAMLSASAVNDFLQTGFRWSCAQANAAAGD